MLYGMNLLICDLFHLKSIIRNEKLLQHESVIFVIEINFILLLSVQCGLELVNSPFTSSGISLIS